MHQTMQGLSWWDIQCSREWPIGHANPAELSSHSKMVKCPKRAAKRFIENYTCSLPH
jgi:hypothetical protein